MRGCRKDVFRLAAISESIQLEGFVTVPSRSIPSHFPFPFASFSFSPPCNTPRSLGTITRLLCSITDHPLLILGALRGAGAAVAAAACVSWADPSARLARLCELALMEYFTQAVDRMGKLCSGAPLFCPSSPYTVGPPLLRHIQPNSFY